MKFIQYQGINVHIVKNCLLKSFQQIILITKTACMEDQRHVLRAEWKPDQH